MRVKQLSNAMPMRNLENANIAKSCENAVITPATAPIMLQRISAGMRPNRSAMKPSKMPPMMLPPKKMACASGACPARSHTQFFYSHIAV